MNQTAQPSWPTKTQQIIFSITVNLTWRAFTLRDRILGRMGKKHFSAPGIHVERHSIPSASGCLDAVIVKSADPPLAAILICHGIGEVVDHWLTAQNLLAANGIASLVFDYTGFGKSHGTLHWRQCEDDAVSAFAYFQSTLPEIPISLLGFSMGSGIVTAIIPRVSAARLILCSAFTSFREAACVLGLPRILSSVLPRIWCSIERLPENTIPVLIMHCDRDRAFPVGMARELASVCGSNCELVVVPNQAHNEAFYHPQMSYWSHIVAQLTHRETTSISSGTPRI